MAIIPRNFLFDTCCHEALTSIRSQLASGVSIKDLAEEIISEYKNADESQRKYLGKYLISIFDFNNSYYAQECAGLFGIPREPGFTLGETIYASIFGDEEIFYMRNEFSTSILRNKRLIESDSKEKYRNAFSNEAYDNTLTLTAKEGLYAMMQPGGKLQLLALEANPQDILMDEEIFGKDLPLYFTESTHFVSPIFKVNSAYTILQYILKEVGYPNIPVSRKVVFTSKEANLINLESVKTAYKDSQWKGVEILMAKNVAAGYPVSNAASFIDMERPLAQPLNQLRATLLNALTSTAIIFDTVMERSINSELTEEVLWKLCFDSYIFLPTDLG